MQLLPSSDHETSTGSTEDDASDILGGASPSPDKHRAHIKNNSVTKHGIEVCCCSSQDEERPCTGFVVLASAMAALGGVLFGYDTGVVSGALLQLSIDFNLDCRQKELIVSALLIGAVLASLTGGFVIDYCGRKATIIANDVLFMIGAIVLSTSQSFITLVIGRMIVGFAVSLSATAECVYISEISPPGRRGFLVSLNELGITFGFLLAYLSNYAFIAIPSGWRYMFSFAGVLAIFQALGMLFLPQSPRYLALKGNEQKAKRVLSKFLDSAEADAEFTNIRTSIIEQDSSKGVCPGRSVWPAFVLALMLVLLQQLTGQPSLLYYAPLIFQEVGFRSNTSAVLASVGLGFVKMICTVIYLLTVDKIGRRTILLAGTGLMMVSITILGMVMKISDTGSHVATSCESQHLNLNVSTFADDLVFNSTSTQSSTFGGLDFVNVTSSVVDSGEHGISPVTWIATLAVLLYIAGYAIGFGPGTWLLMSEIFPASTKGRAMSIATTFNWATNLLVSITLLDVITTLGSAWMFIGYGIVCAISFGYIFIAVPETRGKSLEQISSELNKTNFCCCVSEEEDRTKNKS